MDQWKFTPFLHTALKNLFSRPDTVAYPFKPAVYPGPDARHVVIQIEDCISCGLCAPLLPARRAARGPRRRHVDDLAV